MHIEKLNYAEAWCKKLSITIYLYQEIKRYQVSTKGASDHV